MITLKEVDSTNNFLKSSISNSKPLPEGTVIMAEKQYAGRGQQQNRWFSGEGKNLTFSLLLKPSFLSLANQFDLTRVVSLGVYDALYPLLDDRLKIKWPNDIYYGDSKLGGMLIENLVQGSLIKNSVIGIGLNINQEEFPSSVPNAISVYQILQSNYDLKALLSEICNCIEAWYLQLKAGKTEDIRQAYLQKLYWLNDSHDFISNGEKFSGMIKYVNPNGLLIVEKNNRDEAFNLKEIEFLNK